MPSFDPSTIAQLGDMGPNPARAKEQAFRLSDMANMQQLNQIQLQKAKSIQADNAKAKEIFSQADISTPEGATKTAEALARAGLVDHAMQLQKASQERQSGDIDLKVQKLKLANEQMEVLGGAFDPVVSRLEQMKQAGATPAMLDAEAQRLITPVIQQLGQRPDLRQPIAQFVQQPDALTYNGIRTAAMHTKIGGDAIKQRMQEYGAETSRKREEEAERHNQAMEGQGQQKIDLQRDKGGGLTPQALDEIAEQALTGDASGLTGLSKTDKARARNRLADVMEIRGLKGGDLAAKNAEFFGIKAGERSLGTRQAQIDSAATEAEKIVPIVLEASAKVDRGSFVPWTKLFQIAERGTSDPNLYAFAQAARSLANVYTRAVVPGASGVNDREESIAALPIYTDQASFKAVTDIMLKEIAAAKASPAAVREHLGDEIAGRTPKPQAPEPAQEVTATGPNGQKVVLRNGQWVAQ